LHCEIGMMRYPCRFTGSWSFLRCLLPAGAVMAGSTAHQDGQRMLDLFASVGATHFHVTWTTRANSSVASIASLREVKRSMRPLFAQDRTAKNAGLFLDRLLGDERRSGGGGYRKLYAPILHGGLTNPISVTVPNESTQGLQLLPESFRLGTLQIIDAVFSSVP
jgi:hypothetical protein